MTADRAGRRKSEEVSINGTEEKTSQSPADIEAEIEQQREELAETLDALTAKLDVKSQARIKVAETKDRATTPEGKPRPEVLAAAAAVVIGVGVLVWWRRSR
jgi:nucleotide-binding universal stress UspA family protein